MNDRVTIEIQDGVADVRLNRPDKMNALDNAMFEALPQETLQRGVATDCLPKGRIGRGRNGAGANRIFMLVINHQRFASAREQRELLRIEQIAAQSAAARQHIDRRIMILQSQLATEHHFAIDNGPNQIGDGIVALI